ncbi:DUF2244 domain-containing protein [Sneathiella marina]|uniref:DUF2244 domain-containing protein n=1 Tax=Sneathiella marina TaxID=2950108 RepID=A0ABY4W4X4_9PROT|nr:DUF2244 domain-containing protein [Sneathiella marina]USG61148.1 DUF2244 domain-containing protein [Sneathiella marina]
MRDSGNDAIETDDRAAKPGGGSFYIALHPSRSLSRKGFLILMSAITGISFVAGIVFWSMGAWPVFGFFGLDVLLIFGAFHLNFRAGRRREVIEIKRDMVLITRISPDGRSRRDEFQAYWARSLLSKGQLWITNRGRSYEIGSFLGEEEKEEVQGLIAQALNTYRTGGFLQSPNPSTSIIS